MEAQDAVYKLASGLFDPHFGNDSQKEERSRFLAVLKPCEVQATYEGACNHMVQWLNAVAYINDMLTSRSVYRRKILLENCGLADKESTVVGARVTCATTHGSQTPFTICDAFDLSIQDRAISYLQNHSTLPIQVGELEQGLTTNFETKSKSKAAPKTADVPLDNKGPLKDGLPWSNDTFNEGFIVEERANESENERIVRLSEHVTNFVLLSPTDKVLVEIEMLGRWLGCSQSTKDFHTNEKTSADAVRSLHLDLTSYGLFEVKLMNRDQAHTVVKAFDKLSHRDKKVVTLGNVEMWRDSETDMNLKMDMSRFLSQTYGKWRTN